VTIDNVSVTKLTKRFGHHRALANVSVSFESGRMCALLGPNGAGKSTLLGILSTLVRPSAGKVEYRNGDHAVPGGSELRSQIGVLAHNSFVYPELTGIENLEFYGKLYGLPDVNARATELLDEVGLDERARVRSARTYSRGMLQRLALARALMHDPPLLLLDEPFTGLDRRGAEALAANLARAKDRGCVMIVVTHDLESIADITDHVAVLRRGKLVFEDIKPAGDGFSYQDLKSLYHQYTD
jgi:heme exporter protein A